MTSAEYEKMFNSKNMEIEKSMGENQNVVQQNV